MLDATTTHPTHREIQDTNIVHRIGYARDQIMSGVEFIANQSHGNHPARSSFEADVLRLLITLMDESDPDDRMSIAEDLVDAAGQLRDRTDNECTGAV